MHLQGQRQPADLQGLRWRQRSKTVVPEVCTRMTEETEAPASCMPRRTQNEPVKQGMFGIFEVFMCTMIICTFSAMVILVTGTWETGDPGSVLAINAFGTIGLPGSA